VPNRRPRRNHGDEQQASHASHVNDLATPGDRRPSSHNWPGEPVGITSPSLGGATDASAKRRPLAGTTRLMSGRAPWA
jgi:hypothetical protein